MKSNAFTLAELLIALAILGVIATFTIPKVLQGQQDGRWKSAGKEVAGMVLGAYQQLKLSGQLSTTTSTSDIARFFNYVKIDTASLVDDIQMYGTTNCASGHTCLLLHNGGTVWYRNHSFGGTATSNGIWFGFDPDSQYSGTTNGPGKSVNFWLYYDGKLRTETSLVPGTVNSGGAWGGPGPDDDPTWFSWN